MWEPKRPDRPKKPGGRHRCKTCHGTGQVPGITKITGMGSGMGSAFGVCPDCDGAGWIGPTTVGMLGDDQAGRPPVDG